MAIQFEKGGAGLNEFTGTFLKATLEQGQKPDDNGQMRKQWHIEMRPDDLSLIKKGTTGSFHEWISNSVIEGSNMEKYVQECYLADPSLKSKNDIAELFKAMTNKKYVFVRKKLGKSYKGFEAVERWIPRSRA